MAGPVNIIKKGDETKMCDMISAIKVVEAPLCNGCLGLLMSPSVGFLFSGSNSAIVENEQCCWCCRSKAIGKYYLHKRV